MKIRLFLVGFVFAAAAALGLYAFVLYAHYDDVRRHDREQVYLTNWVNCTFEPITNNLPAIRALAARIPLTTKTKLETGIEESLRRSASDFIAAYSVGSYEAYATFRLGAKYPMSNSNFLTLVGNLTVPHKYLRYPVAPEWTCRGSHAIHPTSKYDPPIDMDEISRNNVFQHLFLWASQGTRYQGYFSDLCVDQSWLRVSNERRPPKSLCAFVFKNKPNLGVECSSTAYHFRPEVTPDSLRERDGRYLYAICKLHVQLARPDPVTPLYCSFYYDPKSNHWFPWELARANSQKVTKINLMF